MESHYLDYFCQHLLADVPLPLLREIYEDTVRAALEEQYLPTVAVPVHHMQIVLQFCSRTVRAWLIVTVRLFKAT